MQISTARGNNAEKGKRDMFSVPTVVADAEMVDDMQTVRFH